MGVELTDMKIEELVDNEDLEILESLKKKGNDYFLSNDFDTALEKYFEAMEFFKTLKIQKEREKSDDAIEPDQDENKKEDEIVLHDDVNINDCMSKIYQNAAVCSEKVEDPESAVEFYKNAIKFNDAYEKAIRKLANLHHQLYQDFKNEPKEEEEEDYLKFESNDKRGANLDHALT